MLNTRDTVAMDTPAARATSRMVATGLGLSARPPNPSCGRSDRSCPKSERSLFADNVNGYIWGHSCQPPYLTKARKWSKDSQSTLRNRPERGPSSAPDFDFSGKDLRMCRSGSSGSGPQGSCGGGGSPVALLCGAAGRSSADHRSSAEYRSSANYQVVLAADGSGHSRRGPLALTSWDGPGVTGLRFFLRDLTAGLSWLLLGDGPDAPATATWRPGRHTRVMEGLDLRVTMETCVLTGAPAELRRVTIANLGDRLRKLDLTSLTEVVLNSPPAHASHPGFSKLFLQTRFDAARRALRVTRRPRDPQDRYPSVVHALIEDGPLEYETDRARFLGRGRPDDRPLALVPGTPLSGAVGNVLDPVVSLRRAMSLGPGRQATLTFLLGAFDEDPAPVLRSLGAEGGVEAAFTAAETAAAARIQTLGLTPEEYHAAQELAVGMLRGDRALRAPAARLRDMGDDGAVLETLGIRTDDLLAVIRGECPECRTMQKFAMAWKNMGLGLRLVALGSCDGGFKFNSGVVEVDPARLGAGQEAVLAARADLWVEKTIPRPGAPSAPAIPIWQLPTQRAGTTNPAGTPSAPPAREDLAFANGHGGLRDDGREYEVRLPLDEAGHLTLPPQPWTNVLANENLGCIVSETGAGATWAGNSREHRLTPWFNDPLRDPCGEALHLRDLDPGHAACFSCTPGPLPGGGRYRTVHGQGYTRFEREGDGLRVQTLVFVPPADPVRLTRVRITNRSDGPRRLALLHHARLVLGATPGHSRRFVRVSRDEKTGALLARNPLAGPFADAVAFSSCLPASQDAPLSHCGDLAAVLGPGGSPARPAALGAEELTGLLGAGLDPAFATRLVIELEAGQQQDVWLLLGQGRDAARTDALLARLDSPAACAAAWETTRAYWRRGLEAAQIRTPSPALDAMVNGWLGFVQGDVLHWWHQPLDRGLRTRFADDLCWLPFATVQYIRGTGDTAILDEVRPYLTAPLLQPGQDEVFLQPEPSGEEGDLYDHCCRALDRSLTQGAHGLPLFGTGDWNDGMNRVGREGRGESVWMGFFLVTILDGFLPLCEARADTERAERYRQYRNQMKLTLNEAGWDGGWFRRGYYDNGRPLGSWENKECAIDALAQAWSVLSEVASPRRAAQVMDAVQEHLIDDEHRLIRLLTPPFQDTPNDPGYIKGYVAGIRENGGQYTHAALWVVAAMAKLGRRDRAAALLDLLNPLNHGGTPEGIARYQVEPYVVAADIYGAPPHVGRGGWTWYTGSSGWMSQVALDWVLGLRPRGDKLLLAPCVPDTWPEYRLTWRVPDLRNTLDGQDTVPPTWYDIQVTNPDRCAGSVARVVLDDADIAPVDGMASVPLARDGRRHKLLVTLGPDGEKTP
ncbi:glycosyl transferase [bacterium DOLJORAL78_65_58]|nr:MAG: glycosyl transferase [bacterium DOLJORAL78_65_58]